MDSNKIATIVSGLAAAENGKQPKPLAKYHKEKFPLYYKILQACRQPEPVGRCGPVCERASGTSTGEVVGPWWG